MQNLPNAGAGYIVGVLVSGDNHLILRGPRPDRDHALRLMRHWTMVRIGAGTPASLQQWTISTKEFREYLQWAVIVPGDGHCNPAVVQLLAELDARGVRIDDYSR